MSDRPQLMAEQIEEQQVPTLLAVVRQTYLDLHRQPEGGIRVTLDSSLDRDLALDSLVRVELLLRVERTFGVTLPENTLQLAKTPRDAPDAFATAVLLRDLARAEILRHCGEPETEPVQSERA